METTYSIERNRAIYHELTDMLYIGYGLGGLDLCDAVEDTPSGITVMYRDGKFAGAEVPFLLERFGSMPTSIEVDAKEPFMMLLDTIETV